MALPPASDSLPGSGDTSREDTLLSLNRELLETRFRLKQTEAQMETLCQAGLRLATSLQAHDVVGEFLELAVAMVDARAGFFFLKDEKTNRFELAERLNLTAAELSPLDGREFRNRLRPIMKSRSCACIGGDDLPADFAGHELLIAPVGTSGFIGVVDRENREGLQPFSDGDGRLQQVMGQQAGMALANAGIYRRMAEERNLNLNIFNSVANGVISTDLRGTIIRVNPAVKRIFGEEGAFFGRSSVKLLEQSGCSRLAAATAQCLDDGLERAVQDETVRGRQMTLNARISPLRTESDQIEGLVITLEDLTEQTRLQSMFKQYASDQVVDLLLRDNAAPALGGEMRTATMLFADVVGSTELLRRIGAEEMVSLINECFTGMVDIVFGHNGTLDKFTGDGFLAVYGAPLSLERDSARAVQTGLDIVTAMQTFCDREKLDLGISIGASRGEVVAGNIGSPRRMEYSVIGPDVNLAARLCDRARSGELLISSRVFEEVRDDFECEHRGRHPFKGLRDPIDLYNVLGPKGSVQPVVESRGAETDEETVIIDLSVPMVQDMEITVSRTAEAVGEFMGMSADKNEEIKLALVEACINAFEHSQSKDRRLQIDFAVNERELTIVVSDRGHGFTVEEARQKTEERRASGEMRRGWGLELMDQFMDEIDIDTGADGTTLTLVKYR